MPDRTLDASDCIWRVSTALGEGPMWHAASATLWFTDIKGGQLHRVDPVTGERHSVEVDGTPSFVVPADDGRLLVGNGRRLDLFDGATFDRYASIDMPAMNRLNDATVDVEGRLWFGSMDEAERSATGRVYCHDRGRISEVGGTCVITNGPAVNSDGTILYHVDTLARTIWRYEIRDGRLDRGDVLVRIDDAHGYPDGVCIDSADHLWVGLWDGWSARRYAPDGSHVATVRFPCANVTKVAFGGENLNTAFATTARAGLDAAALAAQPLAGGLFAFEVDVAGRTLPSVRLAGK